jgi:hypothetical protein
MLVAKSRDARIKAAMSAAFWNGFLMVLTLVGDITHLLQKKRVFFSEIGVYLSRVLVVTGFSAWAPGHCAIIPDQ